jgi:hypothetical protein
LRGVPVALAATCFPEGYTLLHGGRTPCAYVYPDKGIAAAVTDSAGAYYLDVWVGSFLGDSLAVAVVLPDTFLLGNPFRRKSARNEYSIREPFPRENEGFLCSDSIEYEDREVGDTYAFPPDTIIVANWTIGATRK